MLASAASDAHTQNVIIDIIAILFGAGWFLGLVFSRKFRKLSDLFPGKAIFSGIAAALILILGVFLAIAG